MSDRRLASLIVLAALLARMTLYLGTSVFGTDGGQMLRMADHFEAGRWGEALRIGYHPLYPLLISLVKPLLGTEMAGFAVSMALGSAAAAPLFLLTRDAVGRPSAFFGTLLYAVYPHFVELHADVMTEGTFMFFFIAAIWLGWETVKTPRWDLGLLSGLSAGAAYLARAEGILAVVGIPGWLAVSCWRGRPALRAVTVLLAAAAGLAAMFPFLLWSRSVTGRWTISAKGSVQAVEGKQVRPPEVTEKRGERRVRKPVKEMMRHVTKVSYWAVLPLLVLGTLGIRRTWAVPYWLSFPLLYWVAIIWATTRNPYTSYRYLLPGMALMLPLGVAGVEWILRRFRRGTLLPWAVAVLVLVLAPRNLRPIRAEERSTRTAGAWIASQPGRKMVFSTTDKVSWYAETPMRDMPVSWEVLLEVLHEIDYLVYTQKDLDDLSPPWLARIRERFGEPRVFSHANDPAIFVHPVR